MSAVEEKISGIMEKIGLRKQSIIFFAGLAGILLIAFAKLPSGKVKAVSALPTAESELSTDSYEQKLENRLETILSSVAGVGDVQVMVTLESGYRYEYAKENKGSNDRLADTHAENTQKTQEKSTTEENYVMVDGSGGSKAPLITKELEPCVKGVVIVCDGGSDPVTVAKIMETVMVAADISSNRISVSRMRQNLP